ncbi:MAG: class I SAM-dependent methyltransferase [Promethearchaeota archaeon]
MERNKILSKYDHIFIKEQEYYKKEKISSSRDFDLENENFFRLSYLKFKILLGNVKNKKILDVGCGNGALSFYLTRKGAEVIGIDLSINFVEFCKKEANNLQLNTEFRVMNAQIPDFKEDTFDIIVGTRVVHHIPNISLFFRECKRILKKGGFILFIEPLKKNPIVEFNRKHFSPKRRTKYEHPLKMSDLKLAYEVFGNIKHYEYFFLSPVAKIFQNLIKSNTIFKASYKFLNLIEKPLCKINALKPYCWQTVFKCIKS